MVSVNWRLAPPEVAAHRQRRRGGNAVRRRGVLSGDREDPRRAEDGPQDRGARRRAMPTGSRSTAWRDRQPTADPQLPIAPTDTARSSSTPAARPACPRARELINANFTALLPLWTRTWLLAPGVPNLVCLPMFHIGGAGWGIAGLYLGATNHVDARVRSRRRSSRSCEREQLQVLLLVPAMILFLVQAPRIRETDLLEPAPDRLWRRADSGRAAQAGDRDIPVRLPAGLRPDRDDRRDHPAAAGGSRPERRPKKLLSCGYAQEGVELRIVGDDGKDMAPGKVGEIAVRSPQVMGGYWKLPEATARGDPGRLVLHRRCGLPRRGRLSLHLRPREGHDRVGRREHLSGRGRERAVRPSGRRRRRGDRRAGRALGRGGQGGRGEEARRRAHAEAS